MSTEVTPESLRTHAAFMRSRGVAEVEVAIWDRWADRLEREQRPLPEVPGWYPSIVVERGGESCTGALLRDDGNWATPRPVVHSYGHVTSADYGLTIRWAEQDGKTPGQTLWEAEPVDRHIPWSSTIRDERDRFEQAAVLAAHGTPTLTPVGEHPEPGTRGLLPLVAERYGWLRDDGAYACMTDSEASRTILADPRPGGAM